MKLTLLQGNVFDKLPKITSESVDLVITSPPYWGNDSFINSRVDNTSMEKRGKDGRFLKGISYNKATQFKKGQHWRPWRQFRDENWLRNEYIIKQKSAKEIAKENNCHENTILFWLARYKIRRRTISEARKIKYWGNSGEDNPMWNKKGELSPNWKGGFTPERQAFYNSVEWKRACRIVWGRDKAVCQRCGINEREGVPFHIHHITSFSNKEKRTNPDNLVLLCAICHHWVHSKKNVEGRWLHAS